MIAQYTRETKKRRLQRILAICETNIDLGDGDKKVWPSAAVALILDEIERIHGKLWARHTPESELERIRQMCRDHPDQLWDSTLVYELVSITTHTACNETNNPPTKGRCSNCEQLSVRLLNPPLIEIHLDHIILPPDALHTLKPGSRVTWTLDSTPKSLFEIAEMHDDTVLCLAPGAHADKRYCYLCFTGHLWPSLRPYVVNIPPEMRFDPNHPWHNPKWVSQGREPSRHNKKGPAE